MKPEITPEQAKQIEADAPEGATHVEIGGHGEHLKFNGKSKEDSWSTWSEKGRKWDNFSRLPIYFFNDIHALSDLRQIVEQAERIEELQRLLNNADKYIAEQLLGE